MVKFRILLIVIFFGDYRLYHTRRAGTGCQFIPFVTAAAWVDSVAADGTPYVEPVTPDDILLAVRSMHERLLETTSVVVLPENPHEPRLQPLLSTALSSQVLDLLQGLMLDDPSQWEPHTAITTSRGNFSVFVNRDYLRM